jgi:hypothetical protein
MDLMTPEGLGVIMAAAFTLMVYSFFYKENPAYRFAEHVFIGVAVAHGAVISSKYVWDTALTPLLTKGDAYWILPIIAGLLFIFFFSKKYFWIYRIPTAAIVGTGIGLGMAGLMRSQFIDQIRMTIAMPNPKATWYASDYAVNAVLVAIGVIGTLFFFIFTKEQKGALGIASHVGRWTMMVAFGAAFGFTVMARMSLLIGRLQFLMDPKSVAWYTIPIAILFVVVAVVMKPGKGTKKT